MPDAIRCRLVTPSNDLLNEDVVYANVPAHDGLMGIQHGNAPLVSRLGMGKLTLTFPSDAGSGSRDYFIDGGFLKMANNELIILAERAEAAETIIESEARAVLAEAEARVIPSDEPNKFDAAEKLRLEKAAARLRLSMAQQSKAAGI